MSVFDYSSPRSLLISLKVRRILQSNSNIPTLRAHPSLTLGKTTQAVVFIIRLRRRAARFVDFVPVVVRVVGPSALFALSSLSLKPNSRSVRPPVGEGARGLPCVQVLSIPQSSTATAPASPLRITPSPSPPLSLAKCWPVSISRAVKNLLRGPPRSVCESVSLLPYPSPFVIVIRLGMGLDRIG